MGWMNPCSHLVAFEILLGVVKTFRKRQTPRLYIAFYAFWRDLIGTVQDRNIFQPSMYQSNAFPASSDQRFKIF